jgi:hypothetical protein
MIDCNAQPPDLILQIGPNQYNIISKNYIVDAGNGNCELAIFSFFGGGFGPTWILGDPFLRQYCNVHDVQQQRIGFAPAKQKM